VRIRLIVGILLAVFVVALPATAEAITFDKAMDKLVRQGYPQRIVKKHTGFKSNSMGFRWAGAKADTEAARFMAAEMRRIGMVDVRLESVPIDSWIPRTAFVKVGGRKLRGSP